MVHDRILFLFYMIGFDPRFKLSIHFFTITPNPNPYGTDLSMFGGDSKYGGEGGSYDGGEGATVSGVEPEGDIVKE